jgi:hypothetical protein
MDLPLILAVYLVQKVKPEDIFSDRYLVAVCERFGGDPPAIKKRSISRIQVGQDVLLRGTVLRCANSYLSVSTRDFGIVNTDVRLESPAEYYLFTLKRDRDGN